jgi:hypothetical protein
VGGQLDGLGFLAEWVDERDGMGDWLDENTVTGCVFEPVRADGVLERATHLSIDVGDPVPIESMAELEAKARTWRGVTAAMFTGDMHDPDWRLHVALQPASVRISVRVGAAFLSNDTRDQLARWVRRWSELFAGRGCYLSIGSTQPPRADYPRRYPPRTSMRWRFGVLDYYFGRAWHRRTPEGTTVLANVETAPLPAGATRTVDGDVVRVAFPADVNDPASVAAARTSSEDWLVPLVPTEPARGWNELGDRRVAPARPVDLPPFTFYDERSKVGYKALVVDPQTREVDEETWAELAAIARAGQLPDGTPVSAVRLIFPVRDNALWMHARAISDGFEMATYPGNGAFWQVNPP